MSALLVLARSPAGAILGLLWLTLPATAGAVLDDVARFISGPDAATWFACGCVYGAGAAAVLRPTATGLAVLRIAAGGLTAFAAVAIVAPAPIGATAATVGAAALAVMLAWSPQVADRSAVLASVPGERRFALAAPPGLQWILGPLASAVAAACALAPVLVGAHRLGLGILIGAPALGLAAALVLAVARAGRRWLVVVPSGVVLHDAVLLNEAYRMDPDEIGAVALTAPGWRNRARGVAGTLDATGGVRRALWIGLAVALGAPGTRPGIPRPDGPVSHVFCAPVARGEAAAALRQKGYRLTEPV